MKNIKIKKVKLFNKKQLLNVIMDKSTDKVSFEIVDKETGNVFGNDKLKFYINYCERCGDMFVTKDYKEDICGMCSISKKLVSDSLKSLLDLFKDVTKDSTENHDKLAENAEPTEKTSKPKREYTPSKPKTEKTAVRSLTKYKDYCEKTKHFVTPKDLQKYLNRNKWTSASSVSPFLIRAFFNDVYKGVGKETIALKFGLTISSVKRYLDHMAHLGLIYKDRALNKYIVNPTVEVEVINE